MVQKLVAELVGTFVLVFCAVGSAVFGFNDVGPAGVALAFGLVLLALVVVLGPVSGCHVNPAVTLGVLLARRIEPTEAAGYVLAQIVGAVLGTVGLALMTGPGRVVDQTGALGTNSWGRTVDAPGAFLLEVVLTALLVLVVLLATDPAPAPGRGSGPATPPGAAPLAIGATLTVVHLVGIPLDATSVNPARSLGPALLVGGTALAQVWLFVVAPLVGAAVGAGVARALRPVPTRTR